jgi:hypothetical protein
MPASSHSALPLKRWSCVQSLDITSKMPTSTFYHSALPLKRWSRIQSLGITSKMPTSTFYHSALPLKRWSRVQSLDITSKMLTSTFNHSTLPLKRWSRVRSLGITSKNADVDLQSLSVAFKTPIPTTRLLGSYFWKRQCDAQVIHLLSQKNQFYNQEKRDIKKKPTSLFH